MIPLRTFQVGLVRTLALVVLTLATIPATGEQLSQIPDPRPQGCVVDTTGQIRDQAVTDLNELGESITRQTGAELAVVVIQTTNGVEPRQFAIDLFNRWELGSRERNDGLLVLVALADHNAEIILGDGIDNPQQVQASQRIMDTVMVPEFRAGNPERGVLRGAIACAIDILGLSIEKPAEQTGTETPPSAIHRQPSQPTGGEPSGRAARPRPLTQPPPMTHWLLLGGGLVGGGGLWIGLRRYLRYRKRTCPTCQVPMVLLSETRDDIHLQKSEQLEEQLGSVNYDVWSCPMCEYVQKSRYGAFFTSYSKCPQCGAKTKNKTTRTLASATQYSEGREQITEDCKNCDYHYIYYRTIPRIKKSSNSSNRWSSSRSSFSSGSSRSGGHSSGRGASGSW